MVNGPSGPFDDPSVIRAPKRRAPTDPRFQFPPDQDRRHRSDNTPESPKLGILESTEPPGDLAGIENGWLSLTSALPPFGVSTPGSGLLLGADHDNEPVAVRFFRPQPTRIALIGGDWAARLIGFRALGCGAELLLSPATEERWAKSFPLFRNEAGLRPPPSARHPHLSVHDDDQETWAPTEAPWHTDLDLLSDIKKFAAAGARQYALVICQRATEQEVAVMTPALRLTAETGYLLTAMEDSMLALFGGGANRYLWTTPTITELEILGPPRL